MNHVSELCSHCGAESKCRRRDFSEQAWSVLLVWGEIEAQTVDQPLCEACYDELREVLIDRADEMEQAAAQPTRPGAVKQPASAVAATQDPKKAGARSRVRQAG